MLIMHALHGRALGLPGSAMNLWLIGYSPICLGLYTLFSKITRTWNLAIANRSRFSCAHNMLRASRLKYYTVTLESRLRVTQGHCKVVELFAVEYYCDLEIWVRGHWSLKVVPFESLGTASYSPSIVTMAVCLAISGIFSVKQWRDLGNQVRNRSRSLKMAPFDRPYATF